MGAAREGGENTVGAESAAGGAGGADASAAAPAARPTKLTPSDWDEVLAKVGWRDIVVSAAPSNIVTGKNGPKTKLHGINIGGGTVVETKDIALDMLRKVANRLGAKSQRQAKKLTVCEALVTFRANQEVGVATGALVDTDASGRLVQLNVERFLNVLFSEKVRGPLADRDASLSKEDLQDKLAVDQALFGSTTPPTRTTAGGCIRPFRRSRRTQASSNPSHRGGSSARSSSPSRKSSSAMYSAGRNQAPTATSTTSGSQTSLSARAPPCSTCT